VVSGNQGVAIAAAIIDTLAAANKALAAPPGPPVSYAYRKSTLAHFAGVRRRNNFGSFPGIRKTCRRRRRDARPRGDDNPSNGKDLIAPTCADSLRLQERSERHTANCPIHGNTVVTKSCSQP
jgi:hypothetical protein